jgi:hypothetical protein
MEHPVFCEYYFPGGNRYRQQFKSQVVAVLMNQKYYYLLLLTFYVFFTRLPTKKLNI